MKSNLFTKKPQYDDAISKVLDGRGKVTEAISTVLNAQWLLPLLPSEVARLSIGRAVTEMYADPILAPSDPAIYNDIFTAAFRGDGLYKSQEGRDYICRARILPVAFRYWSGDSRTGLNPPDESKFATSRTCYVGTLLSYEGALKVALGIDSNSHHTTDCAGTLLDMLDDRYQAECKAGLSPHWNGENTRPVVWLARSVQADGSRSAPCFAFLNEGDVIVNKFGVVYYVNQGAEKGFLDGPGFSVLLAFMQAKHTLFECVNGKATPFSIIGWPGEYACGRAGSLEHHRELLAKTYVAGGAPAARTRCVFARCNAG